MNTNKSKPEDWQAAVRSFAIVLIVIFIDTPIIVARLIWDLIRGEDVCA